MRANSGDHPVSPPCNYLGSLIREIRCQQGLHMAELAASVGIQTSRLHAIEVGRYKPSYTLVVAIWNALGVSFYEMEALIKSRKLDNRHGKGSAPNRRMEPADDI